MNVNRFTRAEWLATIETQVVGSGALFEEDARRILARLTRAELAAVNLLLALVRDPVARKYQRQKLLRPLPLPKSRRRKPSTAAARR